MFAHYLTVAFRNLIRHKTFSAINTVGLAVGMACTILILLWVQDELSVDQYHGKIDHIYQANLKWIRDGVTGYQPTVSPAIAGIMKNEYPEIAEVVRVSDIREVVLKTNDKMILESNGIAADSSLFGIFTFPLLQGVPGSLLAEPHSIVLTESMARKYFGSQEAVGKVIRIENNVDLVVTGVMRDLPRNSSKVFDFVVPFAFLKEMGYDTEGSLFFPCIYSTFVVLRGNVSYEALSEKIERRIYDGGEKISFSICLLPFKNAYLRMTDGLTTITVLSLIAFFILIIACINFTNLATARSSTRRKEIGIRKVAGASRAQLASEFLVESTLLVTVAAVVSLALTEFFLSVLNKISGKSLVIPYTDPLFISGVVGLIIITGFCAGIYPALRLSGFSPAETFHKQSFGSGRSVLRKVLIVFQFSLSIAFIICTIVMSRQTSFLRNFNLGVNQYNVVYVALDGDIREKYELVKSEMLKNPNISSVTSASDLPVAIVNDIYTTWGRNDNIGRKIYPTDVGYDYLETFGLHMADGRFYAKDHPGDLHGSIVVNESAVRAIGLESPIGKPFFFNGTFYTLIGTVKDFHSNKLLVVPPEPLALRFVSGGNKYLFAKIGANIADIGTIAETRNYVQHVCDRFSPERPLQCQFLSDFSFDEERKVETMKEIVSYSTILALFVSCLGLFGLSMFVGQQKTKEIGIRKTLGASVASVVSMLSKEFLKWVLVANVFAWPAAYWIMGKWLQGFAYRAEFGVWVFALSGVVAFVIAMITVSWQAIRAATINPVDALRYE
jgi:ABC-type antimicrobial peptide transport system permease subunit